MKTEYIVIQSKESVGASMTKDAVTFGFLIFCMWVSHGSRAWTVVCGLMFFAFVCAKSFGEYTARARKFTTKQELAAWAAKPDDQ